MLMRLKNKMTHALQAMIENAKRTGGIPSHIEIAPNEALEILFEIHKINPPNYVITAKDGTSCRLLLNAKDIPLATFQEYGTKWREKEWKVEYNKLELVIVTPSVQNQHLHS